MQNVNFSGQFNNSTASVDIKIGLFEFVEEGTTIIYSPAFDLSGYGKSAEEARNSFEITIDEFFKYTINKKTFFKELKRLGWKIDDKNFKKNSNIKSPELANLISKNDYLADILNEKQFKKFDHTVAVPC